MQHMITKAALSARKRQYVLDNGSEQLEDHERKIYRPNMLADTPERRNKRVEGLLPCSSKCMPASSS
jgi:hypothetical protein